VVRGWFLRCAAGGAGRVWYHRQSNPMSALPPEPQRQGPILVAADTQPAPSHPKAGVPLERSTAFSERWGSGSAICTCVACGEGVNCVTPMVCGRRRLRLTTSEHDSPFLVADTPPPGITSLFLSSRQPRSEHCQEYCAPEFYMRQSSQPGPIVRKKRFSSRQNTTSLV
jgi:hypothetical protein